jgi:hypothetical protein
MDQNLINLKNWVGNFLPRTYNDAWVAWKAVARKGYAPADHKDILHCVLLAHGSRLMAVKSADGKVVIVLVM